MDRRVQNQTNLRKSNETVPNQTELFENRRRCPIYQEEPSDTRRKLLKWDVKWNVESVWNQTGNVKNRTKIFKIARKCPKSPVSQLFRGKKNHSSCYQGFWWIRSDKTLLIYCFQPGRKDSFYGTYLANHSQHWCWMSRADRRSQVEHPQHLFPTFGFLLQQCSSVRGILL